MLKNLAGVTRGAKLAAATAVVAMVLAVAPAQAQDASVSVPAGQTSTVSLPVPVDVSYAGEGWNINASGGSATITAPPEGGQVTVPVTYEGTTISLTLVADGSVTQEDLNNAGEDIANGGDGGALMVVLLVAMAPRAVCQEVTLRIIRRQQVESMCRRRRTSTWMQRLKARPSRRRWE